MTGTPSPDRRFIEESFPVKEVGAASSREKSIRHGHISTLHIWWARRPLAASRATAYAALTPAPKDIEEWDRQRKFIIELCQWKNSNNPVLLERARKAILEAHAARLSEETGKTVTVEDIEAGRAPRPRVLDPFAGGGSYPLEALRLGCEAYANDYNPVAVLIEKATLEYPQKFGRPFEGMPSWAKDEGRRMKDEERGKRKNKEKQLDLLDQSQIENRKSEIVNPLLNAVRYWGEWVLEEARKELAEFYPPDPDGSIPVGYIWARTIPCQNPACGAAIPLMRQFWLAKKDKKKVALYPKANKGELEFRIVGDGYEKWPGGFNPEKGTVARAVATCLVCGSVTDDATTRRLFRESKSGQRMIAVVLLANDRMGKSYRIASDRDTKLYRRTTESLDAKRSKLLLEWGLDPIPDESTPEGKGSGAERAFSVQNYGLFKWGDLFNDRQKLSLITFADKLRGAHEGMSAAINNSEFVLAIETYLALALDMMAAFTNTLARWENTSEIIKQLYARQVLPILWDYAEANPFSGSSGSFESGQKYYAKVLEHLGQISSDAKPTPTVTNENAIHLPYSDNSFDAVLTDPPYYDNVPYSYLSDFFYVWLKRTLGHTIPEMFSTPLTPKIGEIVAYSNQEGGLEAGKRFFEDNLKKAFQEMQRILKPNGIATIVYAHKSTEGWETVINALLDSGLVITSAWPLNTEMQSRLRASESAALASSIYIVARKMPRQPTGFYNDVRTELSRHLNTKLHRLWEEGIGGADFFIAAIGSAIEVFGKYEQVMDYEGNIVRANRLLEEVRTIATDYAVKQILGASGFGAAPQSAIQNPKSEISNLTRLYVLWRWNYGEAIVPFDEARKLAQSCGLDISQAWSKTGFVRKEKEFVRLLGPQGRKLDDLDDPRDLIDVLHKSLLLWEKGQRAEMVKALADRGFGRSEAFYRVAQAISETLPNESKEKKLLDGFLAGRERVQEEVEKEGRQEKLL